MKSFCIAFSMFSKFPVPQFEWKEKDMKFMIAFFPLVGVAIGFFVFLWYLICSYFSIGNESIVFIGSALPIFLSGGIHVDGYMDTMDALHSYRDREKKLEILKDPHIGAFSVIMLLLYYLIYIGAYFRIEGQNGILLLCIGYWFSRILSAVGVIHFPCAKKEGLAYLFHSEADRLLVKIFLYVQLLICGIIMIYLSRWIGVGILAAGILSLYCYQIKCRKEFGGVTGDTSGYFTTLCEGVIIVVIAAGCILERV